MRTNKSEKLKDRQTRLFKKTKSKAQKSGINERDVTKQIKGHKKLTDA